MIYSVDKTGSFEGLIVSLEPADCRNWKNSIGMNGIIVQSTAGVTLAGGSDFSLKLLETARKWAPRLVAADGGADRLLRLGAEPEVVIGDFDSITATAKARLAGRLFPIAEQATTDFDKALRSIAAPFVIGIGFSGARLDHGLAVLTGLVAHPEQRCFILDVDRAVLVRVRRPFPIEPIRTLDAVHLATAEVLAEPPALVTIVTRDARVRDNARALGYAVE